MKYRAYSTFIDYLFSTRSKEHPYDDLRVFLTTSGDYTSFVPKESTSLPMRSIEAVSVPSMKFSFPSARVDARPYVSNSNGLYNETDKSYEEVFNIPLKTNLDKCSYIGAFVQKAVWDSMLKKRDEGSASQDSSSSTLEKLNGNIPFKSGFDEEEYDMYRVSQSYLNSDVPGVIAEDVVYSGSSLSLASGCLIGVEKEDEFFPMGFIDFETVIPCTKYEMKFDPQGLLQLQ